MKTVALLSSAFLVGAAFAWEKAEKPPTVVSQAEAGQDLSLTVYNVGRALVRDSRTVNLPKGEVKLEFRDIAAQVIPETVALEAAGVGVLEQNYEYDLLSPETLLAKFLGREVILVREEPRLEGPGTVRQEITATLLAVNKGTVWRIGDRIVSNPHYRELVFDRVPGNLREKPTLVWLLQVATGGPRILKATYLTGGITWQADYVLALREDGKRGRLSGWITLVNNSGASYPNAQVQLVAGEVHLAPREFEADKQRVLAEAKAVTVVSEQLGEYHLYTLPRPTSILGHQQKQVALLEAEGVNVSQKLVVESGPTWYWSRQKDLQKQPVQVRLELVNGRANNLGIPLPAGVVRVYQRDRGGVDQFMGEDTIPHTPQDETVTLAIGSAFDVVAERVQTDFRSFDKTTESAFEVRLRNHKDESVTVEVVEDIGGDWEMLFHSHPYTKRSAFVGVFTVPVPAHSQTVLSYRVRVRR
ncbi:MAG: DUF4139 domain-containing protein [Thermoanaerobaculaceae bacterium]